MRCIIYQLIGGCFTFKREYEPEPDYYAVTTEPIKHMETFGRLSIFDPDASNNTRIIKRQNVLIIHLDKNKLIKLLTMFTSNSEYWSTRFMNFNENNYPEYFI